MSGSGGSANPAVHLSQPPMMSLNRLGLIRSRDDPAVTGAALPEFSGFRPGKSLTQRTTSASAAAAAVAAAAAGSAAGTDVSTLLPRSSYSAASAGLRILAPRGPSAAVGASSTATVSGSVIPVSSAASVASASFDAHLLKHAERRLNAPLPAAPPGPHFGSTQLLPSSTSSAAAAAASSASGAMSARVLTSRGGGNTGGGLVFSSDAAPNVSDPVFGTRPTRTRAVGTSDWTAPAPPPPPPQHMHNRPSTTSSSAAAAVPPGQLPQHGPIAAAGNTGASAAHGPAVPTVTSFGLGGAPLPGNGGNVMHANTGMIATSSAFPDSSNANPTSASSSSSSGSGSSSSGSGAGSGALSRESEGTAFQHWLDASLKARGLASQLTSAAVAHERLEFENALLRRRALSSAPAAAVRELEAAAGAMAQRLQQLEALYAAAVEERAQLLSAIAAAESAGDAARAQADAAERAASETRALEAEAAKRVAELTRKLAAADVSRARLERDAEAQAHAVEAARRAQAAAEQERALAVARAAEAAAATGGRAAALEQAKRERDAAVDETLRLEAELQRTALALAAAEDRLAQAAAAKSQSATELELQLRRQKEEAAEFKSAAGRAQLRAEELTKEMLALQAKHQVGINQYISR